jgi:hypothetical protein
MQWVDSICLLAYVVEKESSMPRKRHSFFLDSELTEGLRALKARDGILESEAVRRAISEFLKRKGVKTERKGGASRKRGSR